MDGMSIVAVFVTVAAFAAMGYVFHKAFNNEKSGDPQESAEKA